MKFAEIAKHSPNVRIKSQDKAAQIKGKSKLQDIVLPFTQSCYNYTEHQTPHKPLF